MSKKDDSPAISLFSFQDIITSITGIMFLVVLLLLLLIFEADPVAEPPKQTDKDKQQMQAVMQEINNLKAQIEKIKNQRKELEKQLAEYQKMSPQLIEQKKNELEELLKKLTEENIRLKLSVSQAQQYEMQVVDNIEKLEISYKDTVKSIENERKNNKEKKKETEELAKRLETVKKTVVFSVEQSSESNPLLAEFTSGGFLVLDFAANKVHDLRTDAKDVNASFDKFIDWVKQRDRHSETLSIILGPSSLKYWDIISLKLKDLGFRHGLELLGDDNYTLFGVNAGGEK